MYVRNQRLNASQERPTSSNLADLGWVAARARKVRATSTPIEIVGAKAISKVCGVDMARPQEQSWAPPPSNGHEVNVGTIASVPSPPGHVGGGNARCRRMLARWDGGPVVVRGRESRSHGEGVQRDRRMEAERGGRW